MIGCHDHREQSADDRMKRALELEYENSRAMRQQELDALLSGRPVEAARIPITNNTTNDSKEIDHG